MKLQTFMKALAGLILLTFGESYEYLIGVGKADITDGGRGENVMQGWGDGEHKVQGIQSHLYAKAFVISEGINVEPVIIVVVDAWGVSNRIKQAVVNALSFGYQVSESNLMIAGTHTHSAPGGFTSSKYYEYMTDGYDRHTTSAMISGIIDAVVDAFADMSWGDIYMNEGHVANFPVWQRSAPAFNANPASERALYPNQVDTNMLLLKFTHGTTPIAMLNWYAIHPNNYNVGNNLITSDNKGYAAMLFENNKQVMAAFANSNAGDVSGNIKYGSGTTYYQAMQQDGLAQYNAAAGLYDTATTKLQGSIRHKFTRVDMSNVAIIDEPEKRTWPAALGLSFFAGSSEDGESDPLGIVGELIIEEGLTKPSLDPAEFTMWGTISAAAVVLFGIPINQGTAYVDGHEPKPISVELGAHSTPLVPQVVPNQIFKIGQLALVGVPGEPTTIAGHRIRDTVLQEFSGSGSVTKVGIMSYANEYVSYITTKEEYDMQHYEGASTLFGPYTLKAYQQTFKSLAAAIESSSSVASGPGYTPNTAPTKGRYTVRNYCSSNRGLKFYNNNDWLMWVPKGTATAYGGANTALSSWSNTVKVKVNNQFTINNIHDNDVIVINENCSSGYRTSTYTRRYT